MHGAEAGCIFFRLLYTEDEDKPTLDEATSDNAGQFS